VNTWGDSGWIVPHAEYLALGQAIDERCYAYRELFKTQLSDENLNLIRRVAHYSQPVGGGRFREQNEARYGMRQGHTKKEDPGKRMRLKN